MYLQERLEDAARAVHVPRVRIEMRHPGGRRELRVGQEDRALRARGGRQPLRSVEVDEVHLPGEDSQAALVGGRLARRRGE